MFLFTTLLIVSLVIMLAMIAVRSYELRSGKEIISNNFRSRADNKIRALWVAIIKKIVRISKSISKRTSKIPGYVTQKTHVFWTYTRDKIDYFFEKIHRNPKVF
jgi:hypothetical protein